MKSVDDMSLDELLEEKAKLEQGSGIPQSTSPIPASMAAGIGSMKIAPNYGAALQAFNAQTAPRIPPFSPPSGPSRSNNSVDSMSLDELLAEKAKLEGKQAPQPTTSMSADDAPDAYRSIRRSLMPDGSQPGMLSKAFDAITDAPILRHIIKPSDESRASIDGALDKAPAFASGLASKGADIALGIVGIPGSILGNLYNAASPPETVAAGPKVTSRINTDSPSIRSDSGLEALKDSGQLLAMMFPPTAAAMGTVGAIKAGEGIIGSKDPRATGENLADLVGSGLLAAHGVNGMLGKPVPRVGPADATSTIQNLGRVDRFAPETPQVDGGAATNNILRLIAQGPRLRDAAAQALVNRGNAAVLDDSIISPTTSEPSGPRVTDLTPRDDPGFVRDLASDLAKRGNDAVLGDKIKYQGTPEEAQEMSRQLLQEQAAAPAGRRPTLPFLQDSAKADVPPDSQVGQTPKAQAPASPGQLAEPTPARPPAKTRQQSYETGWRAAEAFRGNTHSFAQTPLDEMMQDPAFEAGWLDRLDQAGKDPLPVPKVSDKAPKDTLHRPLGIPSRKPQR